VAAAVAVAVVTDGIDHMTHAQCLGPRSRGHWRAAAADDARTRPLVLLTLIKCSGLCFLMSHLD